MKRLSLAVAVAMALSSNAIATDVPPPKADPDGLVPITLSPDDLRKIANFQQGQTYAVGKTLEPLMSFLQQKELAAQAEARKEKK